MKSEYFSCCRQEMFNDPGIDLSTKSILEQMRQCPFLTFPNEVISNILSRLSPKDRLKARVNKRLNAIEADSKYFEKELNIVEVDPDRLRFRDLSRPQDIYFTEDDGISAFDCIRKIFQNTSIGSLPVALEACGSLYRDFYNIIKEFKNIGHLTINFKKELFMTDSQFFDLAKSCEVLCLYRASGITADALHKLYQNMMETSTKLRKFESSQVRGLGGSNRGSNLLPFFNRIRIGFHIIFCPHENVFRVARIFTDREIEAYKKTVNRKEVYRIFDGNVEIAFTRPYIWDGSFVLKLHETKESQEEAKRE